MRVLVTGAAAGIGRLVAERLHRDGEEVIGVDRRLPDPEGGEPPHELIRADLRKRAAEEPFRRQPLDAVVHVASLERAGDDPRRRSRVHLQSMRSLLRLASRHGVPRVVVVGQHVTYGAAPDAPLYRDEDEPPLAVSTYPELADLVAADLFAATASIRTPELDTVVLRPCHLLGPGGFGLLAERLRPPRVLAVAGFDPLIQVIHEDDAARAVVLALRCGLRGVYNVAGPGPVPLSALCRLCGRRRTPVPAALIPLLAGRLGLPKLPRGSQPDGKYPVLVDDAAFRAATGFAHRHDVVEAAAAFRDATAARAAPPPRHGQEEPR